MYNGNKQLANKTFSKADLGIIALIGKEIVVKFKLPDNICLPIYFINYFPIALNVLTNFLFLHTLPPLSCAILNLDSSFD